MDNVTDVELLEFEHNFQIGDEVRVVSLELTKKLGLIYPFPYKNPRVGGIYNIYQKHNSLEAYWVTSKCACGWIMAGDLEPVKLGTAQKQTPQLEELTQVIQSIKNNLLESFEIAANVLRNTVESVEEVKKQSKSLKWEELGDYEGYYLNRCAKIYHNTKGTNYSQGIFATKAFAISACAYAQLSQVMKAANGEWVPDWEDGHQKKFFMNWDFLNKKAYSDFSSQILRDKIFFKSHELALQAYSDNKELFHQYWMIQPNQNEND